MAEKNSAAMEATIANEAIKNDNRVENGNTMAQKKSEENAELNEVSEFFSAHSKAIEQWLKTKAPEETVRKIQNVVAPTNSDSKHEERQPSELFNQWLSSSSSFNTQVQLFSLFRLILIKDFIKYIFSH